MVAFNVPARSANPMTATTADFIPECPEFVHNLRRPARLVSTVRSGNYLPEKTRLVWIVTEWRRFIPFIPRFDESYLVIRILACPNCDQRCVSGATEMID